MKYKILIILILGTIITSIIYFNVDHSKQTILALGDGLSYGMTAYHVEGYDFNDYLVEYINKDGKLNKYYRFFNETDETVESLITKINSNILNLDKHTRIKHAIKDADLITIALGMDELNNYALKNNLGSTKINGFLKKYDELLKLITSLNHKKILIISMYPSQLISMTKVQKINNKIQELCQKYKVVFIDISKISNNKEYFALEKSYYPNYKGQKYIFDIIEKYYDGLPTIL